MVMQTIGLTPEEIVEDEDFFDVATSTSTKGYPKWVPPNRKPIASDRQRLIQAAAAPSQQSGKIKYLTHCLEFSKEQRITFIICIGRILPNHVRYEWFKW